MNDATTTTTTSTTEQTSGQLESGSGGSPSSGDQQNPSTGVLGVAVEPADTGNEQTGAEEQAEEGADHAPSLPLAELEVLVACIVGILWWLLRRKKKAKPAPQPQPTDPPPTPPK